MTRRRCPLCPTEPPDGPTIDCPVCGQTVRTRSGRPKMHLIRSHPLPPHLIGRAWCEGGNPLQDGSLYTPKAEP